MVDVAQGNGERVGSVERLGQVAQAELQSHHLLHLRLRAASVAGDGALHLRRRILLDGQPGEPGGKDGKRARFAYRQGGMGVDGDERLLDGDLRRRVAGDDVLEGGEEARRVAPARGVAGRR